VVSFTPQPLYPEGKSPWYPLDRGLGGTQSRSGRGGEEKNSQPPPGIEPYSPNRPARGPALYQLSYHDSYWNDSNTSKSNSHSKEKARYNLFRNLLYKNQKSNIYRTIVFLLFCMGVKLGLSPKERKTWT
jgi:hypothetical protein